MLGIHTTLHKFTQIPEFEIAQDDAKQIAEAYRDVAVFYPKLALNDETAAIMNLAGVIAGVYGTRLASFKLRKFVERQANAPRQPVRPPPVATAAQHDPAAMNGQAPPTMQPAPVEKEIRTGEIAGVGTIEFPLDHPLVRSRGGH